MDREVFEKGMLEPREFGSKDNMSMMKTLQEYNGRVNCCMFAMEELAELSKEISKVARGEGDYYNLLQELADVAITVNNVLMMNDYIYDEDAPLVIGSEELDKAMNVKLTAKMEQLGFREPDTLDESNGITCEEAARRLTDVLSTVWDHAYDGLNTKDV